MFQLYLVRLGLFKKTEIMETDKGFKTILQIQKPNKKDFTLVEPCGSTWVVFLSFKDIKENERIKNNFYLYHSFSLLSLV